MRSTPTTMLSVLTFIALVLGGCAPSDTVSVEVVTAIAIAPHRDTLLVGETLQLSATAETANGKRAKVQWSTSAAAVASVSETGLVTGVGAGEAWIIARSGGQRDSTRVVVVAPNSPPPPPPPTASAGFYVAPTGTSSGDGSLSRPWDLATALAGAGGKVQPGDTIWMRGGTYKG